MMNRSLLPPVPIVVHEQDDTTVGRYVATLFDQRWLILKVTLLMTLIGGAYALLARPVYEASMLIHVEEPSSKEANNILGEMATLFDVKTATPSEMELLRSRLVINRAIDSLHLLIQAQPHYLPVVGRWWAEHASQVKGIFASLVGAADAGLPAEPIVVSTFDIPMALEDVDFDVTALPDEGFRVQQSGSDINAIGRVGVRLDVTSGKGPVSLLVVRLHARPAERFTLRRRPHLLMVEEVQKAMTISEQGKQSGVINIGLRGNDPRAVHDLLRQIGQEYITQNLARKLEESQKSLVFLDKQLPDLKQKLENAEARYSQFRNRNGTVDLSEEEKITLQQVAAAKARRLALQQRRTELLPHFTQNHPTVQAIDTQIRTINAEVGEATSHIRALPLLEQEVQRLSREVKVNTDLYTALSNTAQQLRLITIGKVGNVRMVDTPMMPEKPISPNRLRIVALAALAGLLGSMLAVFARKALFGAIDDPQQIERLLEVPVFATIPHSRRQNEIQRRLPTRSGKMSLLAYVASNDIAIESMRTFRTALEFSMRNARNNIVMISGPMPNVGKTFLSVNMAAVLAMTGKRVMLIDSDFRNGLLHEYFDVAQDGGLADYLQGSCNLAHIIHRNAVDHLDFISTGSPPRNPAELLLSPKLGALLTSLSHAYDLVLIDAAPTLAVSDSLIVGAHAGSIYLLARAGATTGGELQESVKRMQQAGLSASGVIFNDVRLRPGGYGYPYQSGRQRPVQVGWERVAPTADVPDAAAARATTAPVTQ